MEKLPPLQKVYEAWSALADGRVKMGEQEATVTSSNGSKRYAVTWDGDTYASNDSASYWQGYAGYPILAVMMGQGRLPYDEKLAEKLSGIDWNALNKRHKRNYEAAAQEAFEAAGFAPEDMVRAKADAEGILEMLSQLPLQIKRKGRPAK
jgi:hypothetical protein